MHRFPTFLALLFFFSSASVSFSLAAENLRTEQTLTDNWRTTLAEADTVGLEQSSFNDSAWQTVSVPHNHDTYHGYRQLRHGNLHGTAWYRRTFTVPQAEQGRRIFLYFEGVGSYATVWVNGRQVGKHAGGLTTFTLDITDAVVFDRDNILAVRADHPAGIRDLPWLCGGCERASGISEGPQPLGIFRPVHVVTTGPIRIEPFGVHAWIEGPQSENVTLRIDTSIKNYTGQRTKFAVKTSLLDRDGKIFAEIQNEYHPQADTIPTSRQTISSLSKPHLWSPNDPYLYTLVSEVIAEGKSVDRVETPFGFRWINWPKTTNPDRRRLLVNGQPFFINGGADYEHLLGNNFAFTDTQINARVRQFEAAGFNAFRDAHHPHNLRFQRYWDRDGLLWWTQFGDTTWFDSDAFRNNFKTLLTEWVKERRNSPSLILWGLQNESLLPTAFAKECSALIRDLDPTASTQRLITTCNGGTGTDWDVPQNWSGTYSTPRPPEEYDEDLRTQSLIGEYGAWRSLGLHTEGGFDQKGPLSEDRFCALMELKIRLAEKARADSCGHFHWPLVSHANPGRNFGENGEQLYDGIRPLDQVGPVNNKGLFTIWGEPTDAFYLYRANFAPKETQPMVYIVSHTWPDRWTTPGKKSGIIVYSNCDEVELFNGSRSLGHRVQTGRGTHFQWDEVEIDSNELHAEARVAGKIVATDAILLNHLPAPKNPGRAGDKSGITVPAVGQYYLYRVNCGGPDYTDRLGNRWLADRDYTPDDSWGALSWAAHYQYLSPAFASQGKIHSDIFNTRSDPLFRTFRYGRQNLAYRFTAPDGEFQIDLFFAEPWYGAGDGLNCTGWRVFDVAVNDSVVLKDLDLWREAGYARAIKKTVNARSRKGVIEISFPKITAGQAVISAIAISSKTQLPEPNLPLSPLTLLNAPTGSTVESHLDTGDQHYDGNVGAFTKLPYELLGANWIKTPHQPNHPIEFTISIAADVWLAVNDCTSPKPTWLSGWERTGLTIASNAVSDAQLALYRKTFAKNSTVAVSSDCTVFATPTLPVASPQFVSLDRKSSDWTAAGYVKPGVRHDLLRLTINRFSDNLTGGDLILPRTDHARNSPLIFTAKDHIEIVGAFAPRSPISGNWIDAKQTATTSDGASYSLRRQRLPAGSTVSFAPGADMPDFAFVRSVRPSATYKTQTLPGGRVEWTIQVGVGDRYGFNFKYRNPTPAAQTISANLEIVQADGSILRTESIAFPATGKAEDWSVARIRTGASINAGTYTLRLTAPAPLELNSLEVE